MQYEKIQLANGLRVAHFPVDSPVYYCGFAINAGTRDELPGEYGLAHFVEHMLFKGTRKRKSWHILNRMEAVGGELNAYTAKEETFLYSISLTEDAGRAIELLSDLLFNSTFPAAEIEKEREVVIDEINSYKDTPSELIYDEFENLLFQGHALGHGILGEPETLATLDTASCHSFVRRLYTPGNMVFFSYGKLPFKKVVRMAEKYFTPDGTFPAPALHREAPGLTPVRKQTDNKSLYQSHVMIGSPAYSYHDDRRLALYLLNNILGGPGMNSRLNLALREKHGLVYQVGSSLTSYSDCGLFSIYFGCDHDTRDRCLQLTYKELKRLREEKLTTLQFSSALKQLKGQLGISRDQNENTALGFGKNILHYDCYRTLPELYARLDAITPGQLLAAANEVFSTNTLSTLTYK